MFLTVLACKKDKDNDETIVEEPVDPVACKYIHVSQKPFFADWDDIGSTYSQICLQSRGYDLTQDLCEYFTSVYDSGRRFYEFYDDKDTCPTQGLYAICEFKDGITHYHYDNEEIDTDWDIVRYYCEVEDSGTFTLATEI